MTAKRVVPRSRANKDVIDAVDHYLTEAGERVALGFVDELQAAYRSIGQQPAAGSPRYGDELGVPGLRSRPLDRYPYLVFYVELADRIDVWRVLHTSRDIPSLMQ